MNRCIWQIFVVQPRMSFCTATRNLFFIGGAVTDMCYIPAKQKRIFRLRLKMTGTEK
jgi:hypothetical protein